VLPASAAGGGGGRGGAAGGGAPRGAADESGGVGALAGGGDDTEILYHEGAERPDSLLVLWSLVRIFSQYDGPLDRRARPQGKPLHSCVHVCVSCFLYILLLRDAGHPPPLLAAFCNALFVWPKWCASRGVPSPLCLRFGRLLHCIPPGNLSLRGPRTPALQEAQDILLAAAGRDELSAQAAQAAVDTPAHADAKAHALEAVRGAILAGDLALVWRAPPSLPARIAPHSLPEACPLAHAAVELL